MPRLSRDTLKVYLVTDVPACRGRPLEAVVAAAVRGGVSCVQLREKDASTRAFLTLALALHPILRAAGIPLVINDRLDIALACSAEGLHLGQSDMPVKLARQWLPEGTFLGLSLENEQDLIESQDLDVDYLAVSPVFPTPTKTDIKKPWGLEGLAFARTRTSLPLVGIGGIDAANAGAVVFAGADGIAVVSAICSADDPEAAARLLRQRVDEGMRRRPLASQPT
jgi:thiamine-phosphate pyrophosphorylase